MNVEFNARYLAKSRYRMRLGSLPLVTTGTHPTPHPASQGGNVISSVGMSDKLQHIQLNLCFRQMMTNFSLSMFHTILETYLH